MGTMRAAGYLVGLALTVVIDVPEDEPWPDEIGSAFADVFPDEDMRPGADVVGVYPSHGTGRPFFASTSELTINDLVYLIQARLAIANVEAHPHRVRGRPPRDLRHAPLSRQVKRGRPRRVLKSRRGRHFFSRTLAA